eukprot:9065115-Pyramimonas_sp.AAC.1
MPACAPANQAPPGGALRSLDLRHTMIGGSAALALAAAAAAREQLHEFNGIPLEEIRKNEVEELSLYSEGVRD